MDIMDMIIDRMNKAHKHSKHNETELKNSYICGCYHCLNVFSPEDIHRYLPDRHGKTALCPHCNTDAVIGDLAGYPISNNFLRAMNMYWFPSIN